MNGSVCKWGTNVRSVYGTLWMMCSAEHLLIHYFFPGSSSLPKQPPHLRDVCVPESVALWFEESWYILPCEAGHKSPKVSASLTHFSLSHWKSGQFVGDPSLVGVRISVGGHRSVGGGSDKL